MIVLGLLAACDPMPEAIPDEPGSFSSVDDLDRLLAVANPDNLVALYIFATSLDYWPDPACPAVEDAADIVYVEGGDCTDMYGGTWHGEAKITSYDKREIEATGFGVTLPDAAVTRYGEDTQSLTWLLDGKYAWFTEDGIQRFETQLAVDFTDERDSFVAWVEVDGELVASDGFPTLPSASGTVGLERWGTAELALEDAASGWFSDCPYPSGGSVTLSADNEASLDLGTPEPLCAPCPTVTLDGEVVELCEPWFHLQIPGF